MRLFIGVLLVTMVVMAMLIDDSEGWRRRRRRRRNKGLDEDPEMELREVVEDARSLLEELDELGQADNLAAADQDEVDLEEDTARKRH